MDLLDRYLSVLRLFLPRRQRDDIVREIAEEIGEQILDQETTAGRPLTVDEQAEVIGRYGHPLVTAARYRPEQHLIGPLVFPYYWIALKVVLALMLFGHAIAVAVVLANDPSWTAVGRALDGTLQNVFAVVAWFTVLAALADRWLLRSKVLERWDPRTMIHAASQAPRLVRMSGPAARRSQPATLFEFPSTTFGLITAVVLSGWWLLALRFPMLMFGAGAAQLDWGPDMRRLYPLLVATTALFLTQRLVKALWLRQRWLLQIMGWVAPLVGALFVVGVASSGNRWVVSSEPTTSEAVAIGGLTLSLLDFVNLVFALSFGFAAVVTVLSLTRRGYQWLSGKRDGGVRSAPAIYLVLLSSLTGSVAHAQVPDDAAIRRILEERIDIRKQSLGIVVGIVTPQGRQVIQHGWFAAGDRREVGPDTELIQSRITRPLGMTSTAVDVPPALQPRLAIGHNAEPKPAPMWSVPALAAGGSLRSTVNDLLTLLAAIGDPTTVAGAAMPGMLAIRRQAPGFQQALGWMVLGTGPGEGLLLHDGSTLGFASSVVYDARNRDLQR